MADVSKLKNLKRRSSSSLGEPPPLEEASTNLAAPEVAPVASSLRKGDARRRRTNRTLQFATRVTPEFDSRIRDLAEKEGLLLVEILERALDLYENRNKG